DRALSSHLLGAADLADLATRAHELARDGVSALGLGGFPAPLALAARALDDLTPSWSAREPQAPRLERMLRVAEATWQLVERALRELIAGFGALGGWTLVAIESAEPLDFDGTTQRIEYLDFTGPTPRGSRQHVTVVGLRGLGRFVYLVRWAEGLAIALEPFV